MTEPAALFPDVRFTRRANGTTDVELLLGDEVVSSLILIPLVIAVGCARLRVDGIGGVETKEAHRRKGYSRRVLEATVQHMRSGTAAVSLLYGIPDFYPKFGFATAGPEYALQLRDLSRAAPLPAGWSVRPCLPQDVPAVQQAYERYTAHAVGAVRRETGGQVWSRLEAVAAGTDPAETDACRVVISPEGRLDGYIWRGRHFWPVTSDFERAYPHSLVLGEVIANSTGAADAALAACRAWGAQALRPTGEPVQDVVLSLPPDGPIYAAALRQAVRFTASSWPDENFMARTLDTARLLRAMQPELTARWRALREPPTGRLVLETEVGTALLEAGPSGVLVEESAPVPPETARMRLPQTELTRLALGALPPGDVLDRLNPPPDGWSRAFIEALFPPRHPYLHLPDRV
jgi:hypothetical protein